MFIKPVKLKSNVQLKGSEVKKLKSRLEQQYQNFQCNDLSKLISNKATVNLVKIITHANGICNVYTVDKKPMFFEEDKGEKSELIPTVYSLWEVAYLLPYFTTPSGVFPRLANGANLMLPGVIRQGVGPRAYGSYKRDQLAAVNVTSNKSAVGIGRLARSSDDLYMAGNNGPCLIMLHVFGDKLWGLDASVTLQIPQAEPVINAPTEDDFPALGMNPKQKVRNETTELEKTIPNLNSFEENTENEMKKEVEDVNIPSVAEKPTLEMDDILKNAFLTALKRDGKILQLPLLTSNFYRVHVLPAAEREIDLKQTSYKKISKFLQEMSSNGLIVVRQETKGVEKICSIDLQHPDLVNFYPTARETRDSASTRQNSTSDAPLFHMALTELYIVTDDTMKLFSFLGFNRGDGLERIQVKKLLKDYISKRQLPYYSDSKEVKLDEILSEICESGNDVVTFNDLFDSVLDGMFHTYEMRGKNEIKAGNKPPILMSLATRSGNKKVTLVSNLEPYGIVISEFAKALKLGVAASTTVIKSPNPKQDQLQVQGNQIRFVHKLLTETYKIKPNQIGGLELAKREKNRK